MNNGNKLLEWAVIVLAVFLFLPFFALGTFACLIAAIIFILLDYIDSIRSNKD